MYQDVLEKAFDALKNSYAPYSNFNVASCVKLKNGQTFIGVNIENSAYGSTMCAERNAIFATYSNGYRKEDIEVIAIVTKSDSVASPCGSCRQVLSELLDKDTLIILSNGKKRIDTNINELLPLAFSSEDL